MLIIATQIIVQNNFVQVLLLIKITRLIIAHMISISI